MGDQDRSPGAGQQPLAVAQPNLDELLTNVETTIRYKSDLIEAERVLCEAKVKLVLLDIQQLEKNKQQLLVMKRIMESNIIVPSGPTRLA